MRDCGWGLDLAGYSTGRSGLARAVRRGGQIEITVFRGHPFVKQFRGEDVLEAAVPDECRALLTMLATGNLAVDVPIDLQGLPSPVDAKYLWGLTLRPVDRVLGGLPPLADRLGSAVARFQNLYRLIAPSGAKLGENLFETYPAASLRQLGMSAKGYKGTTGKWGADGWQGGGVCDLANKMVLRGQDGQCLDDDDLDAAICAITALAEHADLLQGAELEREIADGLRRVHRDYDGPTSPPVGYVLLRRLPEAPLRIEWARWGDVSAS